mmetsp:Transcript_19534/g.36540  ORF Transcript_19534/g.36540 Transcript_19534/m.36540 type:complete len:157 (+) Transcript_19534:188-658(+)
MSVHPTPVSPVSLGSLASFEMVAVNDGDVAHSDNNAAITLELAPDTMSSLNDVNSTVDNAFSVALRMEETLSTLYATGRNDCMDQHPVIRTKLSESNDAAKVGKYSFNGIFFHDNLRKKGKSLESYCVSIVCSSCQLSPQHRRQLLEPTQGTYTPP